MPLQTVEPRRLYRQIADQISLMISDGEYTPGARLPAERDLAKQLGVSRPSVREALIALEVEGLLDVRVGSGIYVTQPNDRHQDNAVRGDAGPFEVIHARWLIEGECAALAAKKAGRSQMNAIREAHASLVRASKRDHNPLDRDRAFHVKIAEASGNSALVLVVQTLWDQRMGQLSRSLERKLEHPKMAGETVREHQAILRAILARDVRAARSAMRRHMTQTHKRYIREWNIGN